MKISALQLAVAGVCGGLAIALSFTPVGYIRVPNISGASTSLHIPALAAGVVAGPLVGALVGLALAFTSWYQFGAIFMQAAGGNLLVALVAAFLPRALIGVVSYYAYRALRRWGAVAAVVSAFLATSTNTVGVLGTLLVFGALDFRTAIVPIILTNYPIEVLLAVVIAVPLYSALGRARQLAASRL